MPKAPTFLGLIGWTYVPIPPDHGILATESNFTFDMRRKDRSVKFRAGHEPVGLWHSHSCLRVPARTLAARGVRDIGTNHVR